MSGKSPGQQVNEMIKLASFVQIATGTSRTDDSIRAMENGASGRHEIASQTGIYNSKTFEKYKSVWKEFGRFCKENGVKLMKDAPSSLVSSFMQSKIDAGCSANTIVGVGSAMNKLDDCLNRAYGGSRDFSDAVKTARAVGRESCEHLDTNHRAFENPEQVISAISDEKCALAAQIELTTGLRAMNVCNLQLNADNTLFVRSKAGFTAPNFKVPAQIYNKLSALADSSGKVHLANYKQYIASIKDACERVGEHYTGSHAFRHNFAQNMYNDCIERGLDSDHAKLEVSEALFHHRIDIVDKYLR